MMNVDEGGGGGVWILSENEDVIYEQSPLISLSRWSFRRWPMVKVIFCQWLNGLVV